MNFFSIEILIIVPVFLLAIILHEIAHGFAAYLLGDPTAKINGRLSLNPLKHLDFFGTLAFFLIHIGWARPVPVNPMNFKNPVRDSAIVSLAGPLTNFILAILSCCVIYFLKFIPDGFFIKALFTFFNIFIQINILLMFFNLLPIPPLDGSKVLQFFIPEKFYAQWRVFEKNGYMILLLIIGAQMIFKIPVLSYIIFVPAMKVATWMILSAS